MANIVLVAFESGKYKARNSNATTIDFLSIKIGASALEIKETAGDFDFNGHDLVNVGTVEGVFVEDHSTRHERAGADEIDGDHLDIDFTPVYYIPDDSPAEADNVDDLAAHLKGIDDALGTSQGRVKISANDTTADYLFNKVVSSDSSIEFAEVNDGGNEDLSFKVNIDGLTATTVVADGDTVMIDDGDNGTNRKMTRANFIGSAGFSMQNNVISNLGAPVAANDAARKADVDAAITGLSWKDVVRVASDANANWTGSATLSFSSPTLTITGLTAGASRGRLDGVELVDGDRVLIKDAATASSGANGAYNGIWVITGGTTTSLTMTRALDMDAADEVPNGAAFVSEGATWADQAFTCTNDAPVTLNTTVLVFVQFTGLGQVVAGDGLLKTGNTLDVRPGNGIEIDTDHVAVDLFAGGGLKFIGAHPAGELAVEPADFAGLGLEDDGSDNLQLDLMSGGGLKFVGNEVAVEPNDFAGLGLEDDGSDNLRVKADAVGGANLSRSIDVNANGVAVKVDDVTIEEGASQRLRIKDDGVSAAKLNADTAGYGIVQETSGALAWDAKRAFVNDNASPITIRQVVYVKSDGDVDLAVASLANLFTYEIGLVADASIASAASGQILVSPGKKVSGFSGLTPGVQYFIDPTTPGAITATPPSASGHAVYRVGHAMSATELLFNPEALVEIA